MAMAQALLGGHGGSELPPHGTGTAVGGPLEAGWYPGGYMNRRSPVSSSSTGWAQVGQYQRASRGVPQARWRRPSASGEPERSAPHWARRRRAPASSRPDAVSS